MLPSKAVTYKDIRMGELSGPLKFTNSIKVLPLPGSVFKQADATSEAKPRRPCQIESAVAHVEIFAPVNTSQTAQV